MIFESFDRWGVDAKIRFKDLVEKISSIAVSSYWRSRLCINRRERCATDDTRADRGALFRSAPELQEVDVDWMTTSGAKFVLVIC